MIDETESVDIDREVIETTLANPTPKTTTVAEEESIEAEGAGAGANHDVMNVTNEVKVNPFDPIVPATAVAPFPMKTMNGSSRSLPPHRLFPFQPLLASQ